MKYIIVLTIALTSLFTTHAKADMTFQMNNILGDWRIKGQMIMRIQKQTETSLKVFFCEEEKYFNSTNKYCSYYLLTVFEYRSDLDAFFVPAGTYCSESLQVSLQWPTQLLRTINPYRVGSCNQTGQIYQAEKLN